LKVAYQNAVRLGIRQRIEFLQVDLLPPVVSRFDLICANLPYIPTATLHKLQVYGKEPELALNGGPDGLVLIRRLLALAPHSITPGGLILLEIESSLGDSAFTLAKTIFPDSDVQILPDLAGLDRLLRIQIKDNK
jgi:release factor glutamine methyltransferase